MSSWYRLFVVVVFVIHSHISLAQDVLYKWLDEKGVVHYTDDPGNVPSKFRSRVEQKTTEKRPPLQPGDEQPPTPLSEKKITVHTDVMGRNKEWWLGQKKYWQDEVDRLKKQIKKNNEDIVTLRRGRVRQGARTEEGIILNQGPLIDDYRELKRLQEITPELESKLKNAQYMLNEGIIRDAYRAGVPTKWIDELKK